jgi:hypothetical protein
VLGTFFASMHPYDRPTRVGDRVATVDCTYRVGSIESRPRCLPSSVRREKRPQIMERWIGLAAGIAGVLVLLWALIFGAKTIPDLVAGLRLRFGLGKLRSEKTQLVSFLRTESAQAKMMQLRGLVPGSAHKLRLPIVKVYVPTSTADPDRETGGISTTAATGLLTRDEVPRVPLSRLLSTERRLLVTAPAGLGKTTFLKYVTYILAEGHLDQLTDGVNEALGTNWESTPIPVYVPLRDLAMILGTRPPGSVPADAGRELLRAVGVLHCADPEAAEPESWMLRILDAGNALVLFDGLDEVVFPPMRAYVDEAVEAFIDRYPANAYVVTARPEVLQGTDYFVASMPTARIETLRPEHVRLFVRNWYRTIYDIGGLPGDLDVDNETTDLLRVINSDLNVRELASSPLFLTIIAVLHYSRVVLPSRRADLYDHCTLSLLGEWDASKPGLAAKSIRWYGDRDDLSPAARRLQLEYIAEFMHSTGMEEAEITKVADHLCHASLMFQGPQDETSPQDAAIAFIRNTALRGGTLEVGSRDRVRFSYRIIEDYLAARRLSRDPEQATRFMEKANSESWRETLRLTIGILSASDPERASTILWNLLSEADPSLGTADATLLAGQCLLDSERSALDPRVVETVIGRLSDVYQHGVVNTRIDAAEILGWLGRLGGKLLFHAVPRSGKLDGERLLELAEYPTTNAQFMEFVAAGGYHNRGFWTLSGWGWRVANQITQPFFWDEPRFRVPSQPVVGVSWFEAIAYARWAGTRLPSEVEWEVAAESVDVGRLRLVPGGEANFANVSPDGPGRPTPVGVYAESRSAHGHEDLMGNVWEWTVTPYLGRRSTGHDPGLDGEESRVLRGGSWYGPLSDTDRARRRWLHPGARQFNFGFRVAR